MISFAVKKKNAFLFFGIGFLIGIVLEIILIQKGIFLAVYYNIVKSSEIHRNPKVACVVILQHSHVETLQAAEKTWLKDCDEFFVFRLNRAGIRKGSDLIPDEEESCERTRLFNIMSKSAWGGLCKVLHRMKSSDCDWFMISPDNLLVLVDNLKKFVNRLDWNEEHYLGHAIGHFDADYNALSAGVVISRRTLSKLLEKFTSEEECEISGKYWRNEDLYLGKYLKQLRILPEDTRDEEGRGRFHGYSINVLLNPGKLFRQSDYSRRALYPIPSGMNCCSPDLITIDATNSIRMFHHYYYIHKLGKTGKPVTITENLRNDGFDWREFLRGEGYNESTIEQMTADEYYQVWANKIPPESLYEMMRKEFGS